MQDYNKLDVWRKAHALTLEVYRSIPAGTERRFPAPVGQLRRATASIPANIVEGCAHTSAREFARFLQIGVASANEVLYPLLLARDLGALPSPVYARLEARAEQVKKMLVSLLRKVRSHSVEGATPRRPPTAHS
jgi:four helix bundle protein